MKCFTHQAKEAVGLCKACNKGICAECAADLSHSIACKSSCEEKAHLLDSAMQQKIYLTQFFFTFMGALFIYFGMGRDPESKFLSAMGIGFLAFAGIYYLAMRKWIPLLGKKVP